MKPNTKMYVNIALSAMLMAGCTASVENAAKDALSKAQTGAPNSLTPPSSASPTASTVSPVASSSATPATGSSATPVPDSSSGTTPISSASPTVSTSASPAASTSGFSVLTGAFPCTDKATMWWEDRNTVLWGCGKAGKSGLYVSTDGGKTFAQQTKFGGVKIQGITRAADKTLYVSGQIGISPVAKVNESNPSKWDYTELYQRGSNAFTTTSQGENVAVTSDGQILVDDLNGTNAVYSPGNNAAGKDWFTKTCTGKDASTYNPDASKTFCELHGVGEETIADSKATAYQITALQQMNDKFYATGRKIDQPAQVRLPSKLAGATYHFQTVKLQQKSNDVGEMLDLYVWSSGRIITVGTDQQSGAFMPLIYLCDAGKDCYSSSNWTDVELDDHGFKYADSARDGRAVDASGDTIAVVGNFVPNAKGGWAVKSSDGGKTWTDLTPKLAALTTTGKLNNLYDVKVFDDGTIMFFGEANFIYTP